MTRRLNRRDALIHLGLGTAGLLFRPPGAGASGVELAGLSDLAERIRRATRAGAFDVASAAIRAGAGPDTLLGAAFLAGVHDVRPRGVGGKLHCVMMVESAFQLAAGGTSQQAWLAALWSLDDFKRSQERDRLEEGDWVLPPRPRVSFASADAARREFAAAMEAWDAERADRAITGLLPHLDHRETFELLWPYAARCYVDIGHKIIFCAQVERALRRIGWRHAEPALRSLVAGLLYRGGDISGSETAVFERSRELARKLPDGWLTGREDASASAALARELLGSSPAQAQDLVVDAFLGGLGPATVWDGLRLYACELFHRRPRSAARRHGPVHGVTEVNAFGHAFRTSSRDATRRLAILQAAGWLPLMRRDLVRFFGPLQPFGLDTLGAVFDSAMPTIAESFEQPSPDGAFLRLEQGSEGAAAFMAQMRGHLVRKAFQSHQYKYVAAVEEESALAHPRWRSRLLAPAVTYVPVPSDPETQTFERSMQALRSAGVA